MIANDKKIYKATFEKNLSVRFYNNLTFRFSMGYFNRFGEPKAIDRLSSLVDETGKMVTGDETNEL